MTMTYAWVVGSKAEYAVMVSSLRLHYAVYIMMA